VRYVQADFRALPFSVECCAGLDSLFTAFGYFDDADNELQLREFRRTLCRGGTLVLDFLNAPHVRATLVPASERPLAGRLIREVRAIRRGRVEKDVEVLDAAGVRIDGWHESVRLYEREELESILRAVGFDIVSVHGDLEGRVFDVASPRLVIVAVAA
jgi:ubiquinone/menaquinone biosynthesis C-methylase UbiE